LESQFEANERKELFEKELAKLRACVEQ